MKYAEIQSQKVNGSYQWINTTNSYFLVINLHPEPYFTNGYYPYPVPNTPGIYYASTGAVFDPNSNAVGNIMRAITFIQQFTDSMTVWNGTSMVSEPITHTVMSSYSFSHFNFLIPPGFLVLNFDYMMGYFLTDDEVREFVLRGAMPSKLEITEK